MKNLARFRGLLFLAVGVAMFSCKSNNSTETTTERDTLVTTPPPPAPELMPQDTVPTQDTTATRP